MESVSSRGARRLLYADVIDVCGIRCLEFIGQWVLDESILDRSIACRRPSIVSTNGLLFIGYNPILTMIAFAVTIFLSAFLLFQVQPLLGKQILPWFGGGAGVWTACMLFYQVLLLVGYAYAHLLGGRIALRWQSIVHFCLLAISLCFLPINLSPDWKPVDAHEPTQGILLLLLVHIGGPYVMLSATGPLMQRWWNRFYPDRSPYRLYALSNAGSLLALVSYPFLVEPLTKLRAQTHLWSWGYAMFFLVCGWCAWRLFGAAKHIDDREAKEVEGGEALESIRPRFRVVFLWIALAATGSVMLLATTNQICQDLAVVPLLWVLPLALYLTTFIICFDHDRWYARWFYGPLLGLSAIAATYVLHNESAVNVWTQILIYTVTLFAACMTCHGELVRRRPRPQHLTLFYLAVSTGGATGGVLVAVAAPNLFEDFWEYRLGLAACCFWAIFCAARDRRPDSSVIPRWVWTSAGLGLCGLIIALAVEIWADRIVAVETSRNFYGVLRVVESNDNYNRAVKKMVHGRTVHGAQFLDPPMRRWPTRYFGRQSGVGLALDEYPHGSAADRPNLRIGIVGLGAGTISVYGKPGDYIRYYEINRDVGRIAQDHFSFLADSPARVEMIYGDARVVLEREAERGDHQQFDVMVMDAFNSDALPMHLLTREAFALYWRHLQPNGLLVVQISNRYLELAPVVRGLADDAGLPAMRFVLSPQEKSLGTNWAEWIVITKNESFLNDPFIRLAVTNWHDDDPDPLLWTDDYASLWRVIGKRAPARKTALSLKVGRLINDEAELIDQQDKSHIHTMCEKLNREAGQENPIVIVTIQSMINRGYRNIGFDKFAARLFRRVSESIGGSDRTIMVVVSRDDQWASIRLGDHWADSRVSFQEILQSTLLEGLRRNQASKSFVACVETIAELVHDAAITD